MNALTSALLASVPEGVAVPTYDRDAVRAGIAHLGVGAFHRSHQAVYVDDLLHHGQGLEWGIIGIGVLPDGHMGEALRAQDLLYTVCCKHNDGRIDDRVVGSLVGYVYAPDDPSEALRVLTEPAIRIVSLTITEGGYFLEPTTGAFDEPGARRARAAAESGASPRPAFELLVDALELRRAAGTPAFTVLSCDNIRANGRVARQALVGFASLRSVDTATWIEQNVAFPNSMVDRITPATTDADIESLVLRHGYRDARPVVCEPYRQWVIEDHFPTGRPPLEDVGATFVDHVDAYELMKLRLLNASHQVIGQLGQLAGIEYVHEVLDVPALRRATELYMTKEAEPTLTPISGVDFGEYGATLIDRFGNPSIADTSRRQCAFTTDRLPPWILAIAAQNAAHGGEVAICALTTAAWARSWVRPDDLGRPIEHTDNRTALLERAARTLESDPLAFLRDRDLVGDFELSDRFVTAYLEAWQLLEALGTRAAAKTIVDRLT